MKNRIKKWFSEGVEYGEAPSTTAQPPGISHVSVMEKIAEYNRQGVEAVIREDRENPESLIDIDSPYPPPLVPSRTAYRDPAIWKIDWREGLPESHPFYVPEDRLVTLESDEYWDALEVAVALGIKHKI